jgi:stage II sporulation protein D
MPRWATLALASLSLAVAACARGPEGLEPPAPGTEPELRVGLGVELNRVTLGGDGELFVTDDRTGDAIGVIPAGVSWTAVPDSTGLVLVRADRSRTRRLQSLSAVGVTEGRFAMAQRRRYRGRLGVFRDRRGLTLVNRVPLESYVVGVTGAELGRRRTDELEAIKAQAVVSRSFAMRNRGRYEAMGFDAFGDLRDQVYLGVDGEHPTSWAAVQRTTGLVLTHDGRPIEAFFHSTCGYKTAGADEAFRTARTVPYLRPVSDEREGGSGAYYCDISPRFRWREEWDEHKLRIILTQTLSTVTTVPPGGIPPVTDLRISEETRSGRAGQLLIRLRDREVRIPGPDIRQVLRPEPDRYLGSTAFQLHVTRNGQGEVSRVTAAGAGWGHGVGLCQWGAVGRARAGQDFRHILETYFPGTTIERAY